MPPEIVHLETNTTGNDYIIGDVHGSNALHRVVDKLQPNDRLFIVGDLFDRGGHEVEVFKLISQNPQIHAVKGNHEVILLNAMLGDPAKREPNTAALLNSGGGWLSVNPAIQQVYTTHLSKKLPIPALMSTTFMTAEKIPEAEAITQYVLELPYIIRVGQGPDAFNICHANMPISDVDLDSLVTNKTQLSVPVKIHLVCARSDGNGPSFKDVGIYKRTKASTVVYCGHNILETSHDSVRAETNHVNLDGGAYFCNHFIMVNHTQKTVDLVGDMHGMQKPQVNVLKGAVKTISNHIRQPITAALHKLSRLQKSGSIMALVVKLLDKSKKNTTSKDKYKAIIQAGTKVAGTLKGLIGSEDLTDLLQLANVLKTAIEVRQEEKKPSLNFFRLFIESDLKKLLTLTNNVIHVVVNFSQRDKEMLSTFNPQQHNCVKTQQVREEMISQPSESADEQPEEQRSNNQADSP